jgi:hypothetical protein
MRRGVPRDLGFFQYVSQAESTVTFSPKRRHERMQLSNEILRSRVPGGKMGSPRGGSCEVGLELSFEA